MDTGVQFREIWIQEYSLEKYGYRSTVKGNMDTGVQFREIWIQEYSLEKYGYRSTV